MLAVYRVRWIEKETGNAPRSGSQKVKYLKIAARTSIETVSRWEGVPMLSEVFSFSRSLYLTMFTASEGITANFKGRSCLSSSNCVPLSGRIYRKI